MLTYSGGVYIFTSDGKSEREIFLNEVIVYGTQHVETNIILELEVVLTP